MVGHFHTIFREESNGNGLNSIQQKYINTDIQTDRQQSYLLVMITRPFLNGFLQIIGHFHMIFREESNGNGLDSIQTARQIFVTYIYIEIFPDRQTGARYVQAIVHTAIQTVNFNKYNIYSDTQTPRQQIGIPVKNLI